MAAHMPSSRAPASSRAYGALCLCCQARVTPKALPPASLQLTLRASGRRRGFHRVCQAAGLQAKSPPAAKAAPLGWKWGVARKEQRRKDRPNKTLQNLWVCTGIRDARITVQQEHMNNYHYGSLKQLLGVPMQRTGQWSLYLHSQQLWAHRTAPEAALPA